MNTDFRISVSATSHPKILKLMRRCGDIAFFNLIKLWTFVAQNRPDGDLTGLDADDIELAAGWTGQCSIFYRALLDLCLIDSTEGGLFVHDWQEHNTYAAFAQERSDKAKKAAKARWGGKKDTERMLNDARSNAQRCSEQCSEHTVAYAPSPSPSPSPKIKDSSLRSESSCPELPQAASELESAAQKPEPEILDQPEPAILTFPLAKKGETFAVTQPDIGEWQESFPGVDVLLELRHCLQWSRDNPTRRKTKNGIRKHITAWLGKAQDRTRGQPQAGHAGPGGYPAPRTVKDAITIQQDMEAKRLLEKKLRERGMTNGNGDTGGGTGCSDDAQHQIGQGVVQRQRFLAGPGIH